MTLVVGDYVQRHGLEQVGRIEQVIENGHVQVRWGATDAGPILTLEHPNGLRAAPPYEHKDKKDELPE